MLASDHYCQIGLFNGDTTTGILNMSQAFANSTISKTAIGVDVVFFSINICQCYKHYILQLTALTMWALVV
jgi:hypothetical protein